MVQPDRVLLPGIHHRYMQNMGHHQEIATQGIGDEEHNHTHNNNYNHQQDVSHRVSECIADLPICLFTSYNHGQLELLTNSMCEVESDTKKGDRDTEYDHQPKETERASQAVLHLKRESQSKRTKETSKLIHDIIESYSALWAFWGQSGLASAATKATKRKRPTRAGLATRKLLHP